MEEPSNDTFCSLDMLAEVASATLQSDPSLISNLHRQQCSQNNIKVSSSSSRKSTNSSEKLTLDQIKRLSEKNLIEMFSEHICDEMKRNYSFQCYLMPEECCQIFKSFGNETRAHTKMKAHLLTHIKDLIVAANDSTNQDVFMAEPLHIRRKRLKEVNRKNTRKKKQNKTLCNKYRKDNSYEQFSIHAEGLNFFKTDGHPAAKAGKHTTVNSSSKIDFDSWNSGFKTCLNENSGDYINDAPDQRKYLPYLSSDDARCADADQVLLNSWSYNNDLDSTFPKNIAARKKQRSKHLSDSKKKYFDPFHSYSLQEYNSDYEEEKSHLDYDLSETELCLPIHHDHTYTSVNESFSCDSSSSGERKFSNDIYLDPEHQCLDEICPLVIPTPAFPYVYNPVLPHIARIQEVGHKFKKSTCTCVNVELIEGLWESTSKPKLMHHSLPKENECLTNFVSQVIHKNNQDSTADGNVPPTDTYIDDAVFKTM